MGALNYTRLHFAALKQGRTLPPAAVPFTVTKDRILKIPGLYLVDTKNGPVILDIGERCHREGAMLVAKKLRQGVGKPNAITVRSPKKIEQKNEYTWTDSDTARAFYFSHGTWHRIH